MDADGADLLAVVEPAVPTQITFGSLGATVSAPTEEISGAPPVTRKSEMFDHDWPPFVVFHTPPFTAPK